MPAWSLDWPTEEGWYWFYGWYARERPSQAMLRPMQVVRVSNGVAYIGWGTFLYKSEFDLAMFLPLAEPVRPDAPKERKSQ